MPDNASHLHRLVLMKTNRHEQSANLLRIRNNQRRSRARRKEYLEELEKRLLHFERAGISASAEIQAAARKVSEENTKLRLLLKSRGVGDVEVEDFLRVNGDGSSEPRAYALKDVPNSSRVSKKAVALSRQPLQKQQTNPSVPRSTVDLEQPKSTYPSHPLSAPVTSGPRLSSTTTSPLHSHDSHLPQSNRTSLTAPPGAAQDHKNSTCNPACWSLDNEKTLAAENATSCMIAARIIAGMRGDDNTEEAGAELGCPQGVECEVDNMAIFQAMDRGYK